MMGNPTDVLRADNARVGNWLAVWFRRILLGIIIIEIPLQLDKYLLHDLDDAQFGAISGFNLSLTTLCLFFLYALWLPRVIVESTPIRMSKSLTAFLAIMAASLLWATDKNRTLYELFMFLQAFLIFTYLINHLKTRADVLVVMSLLMIGLVIQGASMVAVTVLGDDIRLGPLEFQIYSKSRRATGSLASPNVAGGYIALLLAPALSLFFLSTPKLLKLAALAALILGGVGLMLTMSRGGWLAAAISLTIFCTIAYRKRWLSPPVFAILVMSVVLLLFGFQQTLSKRMLNDDGGSAVARVPLNDISKSMIADHPLGVGANNWDIVATKYAGTGQYRAEWFFIVHNKYLLVCSELGWPGLIAFVVFLGSIVVCGWRLMRQSDFSLSPLAVALTAAIVGQMIHMSIEIFNSRAQIQMFCLVAALVFAISNIRLLTTVQDATEDQFASENAGEESFTA